MTKSVAGELRQYGISVNCVAPGGMLSAGVFTEGSEAPGLYGPEYLEVRKANGGKTPVAMNPDQVALAVYALCTPMSDFMCGETIDVDGGVLMNIQERPFSFTVEGCICKNKSIKIRRKQKCQQKTRLKRAISRCPR